jgi:response regulator NasT
MADGTLAILVIDDKPERAAVIEEGLREAGHSAITIISDMRHLLRQIADAAPDVIIIDLENPNRDVLEEMFQVSRSVPRPVAMFVDQSDRSSIEAAIEAGVSAYVVDGMRKERIRPVVDMAISRYNAYRRLKDELDRAKQALEDRKVIERAKGILMKTKGVSEAEAHALLRKTAMNESRRVAEVAQALVMAAKLLG